MFQQLLKEIAVVFTAETERNKQVIDPLVRATHFESGLAKEKKGELYISIHLHIWPPAAR